MVIPEGIASYDALVMAEKKYGKANMRPIVLDQLWSYLFIRRHMDKTEHPLIKADAWFEWGGKAAVALYGLKDLIGEDSLNNALREFKNAYAFKNKGPFAGSNDLFRYVQKHTPDSLQYYLTDTWQKITLYDDKILAVNSVKTTNQNEYKVTVKMDIDKAWIDAKGNDVPVINMNDYIDLGIFGRDTKDKTGRTQANLLYLKRYRLKRGAHELTITVKGKPENVVIDPSGFLIDRNPNDNSKAIE